jgi:hypothetical protein
MPAARPAWIQGWPPRSGCSTKCGQRCWKRRVGVRWERASGGGSVFRADRQSLDRPGDEVVARWPRRSPGDRLASLNDRDDCRSGHRRRGRPGYPVDSREPGSRVASLGANPRDTHPAARAPKSHRADGWRFRSAGRSVPGSRAGSPPSSRWDRRGPGDRRKAPGRADLQGGSAGTPASGSEAG